MPRSRRWSGRRCASWPAADDPVARRECWPTGTATAADGWSRGPAAPTGCAPWIPRPRRPRRPRTPVCGPAPWASSSARAADRAPPDRHRGGPESGARPSTTCSSPDRPAGKTSLAGIVAAEMGVGLRITAGPVLVRSGDLAALLTDLQEGDVLSSTRSTASTGRWRRSSIRPWRTSSWTSSSARADGPEHPPRSTPLHPGGRHHPDRAGGRAPARPLRVRRSARPLLTWTSCRPSSPARPDPRGAHRAEGASRIAERPGARPASPTGCCGGCGTTSRCGPRADHLGGGRRRARGVRRRRAGPGQGRPGHPGRVCRRFAGRPVGLTTLAQCIGEEPDTIEDAYEPYLLQQGLLQRTTRAGWRPAGLGPPRVWPRSSPPPLICPGAGRRRTPPRCSNRAPDRLCHHGGHVGVPRRGDASRGPPATSEVPDGRLRLRPSRQRPSPSIRSSPAARPDCSSGPGLAGNGTAVHATMADLPRLLDPGDVVVVNDTRVLAARLGLVKSPGGRAEVLLLEPAATDRRAGRPWSARAGGCPSHPAVRGSGVRRWSEVGRARWGTDDGRRRVRLLDPAVVERAGTTPLPALHPPSARRSRALPDGVRPPRRAGGAVGGGPHRRAALHPRAAGCRQAGATLARVDLAIGLDTFRPITAATAEEHVIHTSATRCPAETMAACAAADRVVAVGTTVVRALESAAATGGPPGRTNLYIHGGVPFRVVDVLVTNFHLPRSSLLLLVEAFCGPGVARRCTPPPRSGATGSCPSATPWWSPGRGTPVAGAR